MSVLNSGHIGAAPKSFPARLVFVPRRHNMPVRKAGAMQFKQGSSGVVTAVCLSGSHSFSKPPVDEITLLTGLGVAGDAHSGKTVKHRSRVAADPTQPNLRQIHLIAEELHHELLEQGFRVGPGTMGENITTRGLDLINLPRGTKLQLGDQAIVEITGLRNPCKQLNDYQPGLMNAVLDRDPDGNLVRKAGIMGIVVSTGAVKANDLISVSLPSPPFERLERV